MNKRSNDRPTDRQKKNKTTPNWQLRGFVMLRLCTFMYYFPTLVVKLIFISIYINVNINECVYFEPCRSIKWPCGLNETHASTDSPQMKIKKKIQRTNDTFWVSERLLLHREHIKVVVSKHEHLVLMLKLILMHIFCTQHTLENIYAFWGLNNVCRCYNNRRSSSW